MKWVGDESILNAGRHVVKEADMGVMVAYGRKRAFLRAGTWRSSDASLEARLNAATREWVEDTGGPPLDCSDPEREAAREIAKRTGGRLTLHAPVQGARAHRVWLAQRQYKLAFG
jgi:hypothetical protein